MSKKNDNVNRSAIVAKHAEIESFRLVSLTSRIDKDIDPYGVEDVNAAFDHDVSFKFLKKSIIKCYLTFNFRATDSTELEPFILINATFEIIYNVPSSVKIKRSDIRAFCELNALFNTWPYWRELLQNQTVKMGCPPLIIPLLKVPS